MGHTSLTGVLELKNKINLGSLNYVTCASTMSEEETWVRGAHSLFLCYKRRAHVETRQTNRLKNVKCFVNDEKTCCECSLIDAKCA